MIKLVSFTFCDRPDLWEVLVDKGGCCLDGGDDMVRLQFSMSRTVGIFVNVVFVPGWEEGVVISFRPKCRGVW